MSNAWRNGRRPGPRSQWIATVARVEPIDYDQIAARLTQEALELLERMAEAHLESTGDRLFIDGGGWGSSFLLFAGSGGPHQIDDVDKGALRDLCAAGLVHEGFSTRGTPNYRVAGEGLNLYRQAMSSRGGAVTQVEDQVLRLTNGTDFARRHPATASALREAFDLLASLDATDDRMMSALGTHLRGALMDVVSDVVGSTAGADAEKPVERLSAFLKTEEVPAREAKALGALVDLADTTLRVDMRLTHAREERDKGEPDIEWEEARRAAFLTAVACYEIGRLGRRQSWF